MERAFGLNIPPNSYGCTVTIQVTLFEIEHLPALEIRIMWA
jgi:hypothetical protein